MQVRWQTALDLRRAGKTYKLIGEIMGVSATRASAFVLRAEREVNRQIRRRGVLAAFASELRRGRPIDMGGPRDTWQVWTPEMQHLEFERMRG